MCRAERRRRQADRPKAVGEDVGGGFRGRSARLGGIIELALGFWAAGYYGRSGILLVAWVAAIAVIRGVNNIVLAFRVREVQHPASV
jgi:uncharacterized membrane protein HdeD (DUF308 family)